MPTHSKQKGQNANDGTRATRLEDFLRVDPVEKQAIDAAKSVVELRNRIEYLQNKKKEIEEGLKSYIEGNKKLLASKGIISERKGDLLLKLEGFSISLYGKFYIPDESLGKIVDKLKEKEIDDEFIRYVINKTFLEGAIKEHYNAASSDRLRMITEEAMKENLIEPRKVIVVKKDYKEKENKD